MSPSPHMSNVTAGLIPSLYAGLYADADIPHEVSDLLGCLAAHDDGIAVAGSRTGNASGLPHPVGESGAGRRPHAPERQVIVQFADAAKRPTWPSAKGPGTIECSIVASAVPRPLLSESVGLIDARLEAL